MHKAFLPRADPERDPRRGPKTPEGVFFVLWPARFARKLDSQPTQVDYGCFSGIDNGYS